MLRVFTISLATAFIALSTVGASQDVAPRAPAKLLTKLPTIDGTIQPGEWDEAYVSEEFRDVVTGNQSKDKTRIHIGYTSKSIFLAYYCFDSEPEKIVGRETIPNANFKGEDQVFLLINPYGNRNFEQQSQFIVNALGTKTERIAGGRTDKREWRGEWKAAATRVADGWVCEIEIPWQMLNYAGGKSINMDINFIRLQGKNQFEQRWANARLSPVPLLEGWWDGVNPPEPAKPKIQFLGYTAPEVNEGKFQNRVGLDARYQFSPSFTGVVSVAPDFRNIQDSIAGINFVRTERFLNESRPFFNEGAGFFRMGGQFDYATMFYSRRIQDFDVAVKAFGQITPKLALGALYTNKNDGQKAAAFRAVHTLSPNKEFSYFGTLDSRGTGSEAYGFGYSNSNNRYGISLGGAIEKDNGTAYNSAGSLELSSRVSGELFLFRYIYTQPDFTPSLGYVDWNDRQGFYLYNEIEKEYRTGPFRLFNAELYVPQFKTFAGVGQEQGFDGDLYWETRGNVGFQINRSRIQYGDTLDDTTAIAMAVNQNNRMNKIGVRYQTGTTNNLPSKFIAAEYNRRFLKGLDFSLVQTIQELDGTSKQTIGTLAYQISPQDLISSRLISNSNGTNIFFSYRRAGFAGAEYYFIYGDPNAPQTTNRISLKAVWAF
jgi:hypothetical protein